MNTFYKTISDYYDYIFPYNPKQLRFIKNSINNKIPENILEVGCATGNLTSALSKISKNTYGIDLDDSLLSKAKQKNNNKKMHLKHANMLDINNVFAQKSMNTIICFGNTLVHLNNIDEIERFISSASKTLNTDGTLMLQTINYDLVINKQLSGLPTIDNDEITFVRKYKYLKELNKIEFATELSIKSTNKILKDSQLLYPLLHNEIETILKQYFKNIQFYGNFNGDEFDIDKSQPMIIVAK